MTKHSLYLVGALVAGGILALMIFVNGELARHTSAEWSSLVAHGIGAGCAFVIWQGMLRLSSSTKRQATSRAPWWSYVAGIFGAIIVILASITVNSPIGLSGSISLMLLGQVLFGLLVDYFGWFGMPARDLTLYDFGQVFFIMSGTAVLIFLMR
jgi:bacterial/archaeal transporter family-2 protein